MIGLHNVMLIDSIQYRTTKNGPMGAKVQAAGKIVKAQKNTSLKYDSREIMIDRKTAEKGIYGFRINFKVDSKQYNADEKADHRLYKVDFRYFE